MGDPEPGPEPVPDAALAGALGRGEVAGLLAVHDAYASDLTGYAEFLLAPVADGDLHVADEAAAAVYDALLAGTVAVADLTDVARFRAWLLALTRNECLRRRPAGGATAAPADEAAELGRRGLRSREVALVLGFAPAALPRRVPAREAAPLWLRTELAAAGGPAGTGRRAELARRARPFDQDGFPVPLDRRRLSGRVLAWSAAAVVLVAAGVLVAVPSTGDAAAGKAGPVLAAAAAPSSTAPAADPPDDAPLPTLADTPFGAGSTVPPRPSPAADRGADRRTTPAGTPSPTPGRPGTAEVPDRAPRGGGRAGTVAVSWAPAAGLSCDGEWTARLHATTTGTEASTVVAVAANRSPVALHRDGAGWSGDLAGLPTDRPTVVTVWADGAIRPAHSKLSSNC